MRDLTKFYIGGEWVAPKGTGRLSVINPATEQQVAEIALGTEGDVDDAVAAARKAFDSFSQTSPADRVALLQRIMAAYQTRMIDLGAAVTEEMGAPSSFALQAQVGSGLMHVQTTATILGDYPFTDERDGFELVKEPIGVVGMITPWNWPLNQILCKVAPALAAGCTIVLKPSEVAPISAHILAEVLEAAEVPPGVFNMVHGTGVDVGAAISVHPQIDMVSFTGSTRAGVEVAKAAAATVKRVAQELGGKSANIVMDDADLAGAVSHGVFTCMMNSGQSCNAPTRLLVPQDKMDEAIAIAQGVVAGITPGDPTQDGTVIGPVVSEGQWTKIQGLIQQGVDEGARLVAGGPGKPEGLETGYYVKPTIFADVTNEMTIAREEIFGPVLCILPYKDEDDAVAIANDTPYGLSGYVSAGDLDRAKAVARRLRTGNVHLNGAAANFNAPFGGYKQSGNGREWGEHGFEEFLETKALIGTAG